MLHEDQVRVKKLESLLSAHEAQRWISDVLSSSPVPSHNSNRNAKTQTSQGDEEHTVAKECQLLG